MSRSPEPSTNSITSLTDYELLQETFKRLKIEFNEFPREDDRVIRINEGDGYAGFYTDFYFDKNGKFIEYGIWE